MKQTFITLLILLGVTLTLHAAPSITWLETIHDFGAFDESMGAVSCQFRYVNTGDEPLVVIRATASCGCTRPKYDQEPLAPGDTAAITVAYDPAGRPGRFSKKITVETNTSPATTKLTVKGVVIGDANTIANRYPNNMGDLKLATFAALLGTAKKHHIRSVFIDGYNRSADTIVPVVTTRAKWLEVTPAPRRVAPGERVSFNFFITPDHTDLYGLVVDSVYFSVGNDSTYALPVIVTLEDDFSRLSADDYKKAPVARISNDTLSPDDFHDRRATVSITNDGHSTLTIHRVYTMMPGIEISLDRRQVKRGKSATLTLQLNAPQPQPIPISIITNDPISPVQTLTINPSLK